MDERIHTLQLDPTDYKVPETKEIQYFHNCETTTFPCSTPQYEIGYKVYMCCL